MADSRRPVLLAVDDDPLVLRAIRRDLVHAYADRYRILAAASGPDGLRVLDDLELRREELALLIADQRMPQMTGVEFLGIAGGRFPLARRVLLTAYADTDVASDQILLDRLLAKPWEPPAMRLYPVLNELLEDWQASRQPGPDDSALGTLSSAVVDYT